MLKHNISEIIRESGSSLDAKLLEAFIQVESAGKGFTKDGKLVIAFESHVFRKKTGFIVANGIDVPSKEWIAFNTAFKLNANAAMESTSIGLPQIMGYHWKRLGYESVGAMWDDFKISEENQIKALVKFIETDSKLKQAINRKDFLAIANIYNGPDWALIVKKTGRVPYPDAIKEAYIKLGGEV